MYKQAGVEARKALDVQRDGMDMASRDERDEPDSCNPLVIMSLNALHAVAIGPLDRFRVSRFRAQSKLQAHRRVDLHLLLEWVNFTIQKCM